MSFRRDHRRRRLALWVRGALTASVLATAAAGEKMVESPPSKKRPEVSAPAATPAIDPILDRILNPNGSGSSFSPGGIQSMPVVPPTRPGLDPLTQKRLGQQLDKRRNWLLENAAQINSQGQIREKQTDDTPRFSQPAGAFAIPGAGERYLRATDPSPGGPQNAGKRGNSSENQNGLNPGENPDGTELEGDASGEAARAVPFRSWTGEATGLLKGKASEVSRSGKEVFSESGPFSNPGRSLLEDTRRTAMDERNAVFDRLLTGATAGPAGPEGSAPSLNSLGLSTLTPSRSQQFQSLLAGPEAPAASANVFGSPFAASGAARPSGFLAEPNPSANLGPIGPVAPQRPAAVRMEPRPALLQIPTRGF